MESQQENDEGKRLRAQGTMRKVVAKEEWENP